MTKARQKARSFLLLLSFLLFPVTIFYFSPVLIIRGASEGVINGSFIVYCSLVFASLFLGRAPCGWLNPCGALQEMVARVNEKPVKQGKLRLLKYFLWAPWILTIVTAALYAGGYSKVDFFYFTDHGISISEIWMYAIYYTVIVILVIVPLLLGRRAFCYYLCPVVPLLIIGRKIANALKIPRLSLRADTKNCVDCKVCNTVCPMGLTVSQMVKEGKMENAECILCGKCADSCPRKAINFSIR